MPTITIGDNSGDDFSGTEDNELWSVNATTNYGSATTMQVAKWNADPDHRHVLIKFSGISNLPGSLLVSSVTLYLYLDGAFGGTYDLVAKKLNRDWVEAEATWNIYSTGNNWTTGGALHEPNDRSATKTFDVSTNDVTDEYKSFTDAQLAADVEDFADGTLSNYGWHIEEETYVGDRAKIFNSKDAVDTIRPYLSVTYIGPYPSYEDNGGIAADGGASVDVPYPATVNENDILIVTVLDADNDSFNTPANWAKIAEWTTNNNCSLAWFWKRAVGDETGTETFTSLLVDGAGVYGVMARFSNCVESGTPYEDATKGTIAQDTTIDVPTITTTDVNELACIFAGIEDNVSMDEATGYTEKYELFSTLGNDAALVLQTQAKAAAGDVNGSTPNIGGNDYRSCLALALFPTSYVAGDISINVFDGIGIAESLTPLQNLGVISKYENITISEFLSLLTSIKPNVFEGIDIVEFVKIVISIKPNVFENITVSEYISMLKDIMPSIFDNIGISEYINAVMSSLDLDIDVTESIGISELVNLLITLPASVTEGITVQEYVNLLISTVEDIDINVFDGITVSEYLSTKMSDLEVSTQDLIDIAETVLMNMSMEINIYDTIAIVENIVVKMNLAPVSIIENINVSEYVDVMRDRMPSVHESITVSEWVGVALRVVFDYMKLSFAERKPNIAFTTRQPEITFTVRKPGITFS